MTLARRWWLFLHRYVGLSAGLLLVLMGLSGSIITYQHELDVLLHPTLLTTRSSGAPAPLERGAVSARAALPAGATLQWARLPHERQGAISWFYKDVQGRAWELTSDPYTAEVLGQRRSDTHALALIYAFHATLLLGLTGNVALGILAFVVLFLIGAGIWLWWPRPGRWRQALTVKLGAGKARLHFDLHRAAGIYASPLLLLSAFTGIYMALPPVMTAMVSLAAPVTAWVPIPPRTVVERPRISLDEAVGLAQQHFPGALPKVLALPDSGLGAYEINLYRPGDRLWLKAGEWTAYIDPASGATLRLDSPVGHASGDKFIAWMFPLHSGEAFGETSRAVICALGMLPLLLAVTGASIWWRKRRTAVPPPHPTA